LHAALLLWLAVHVTKLKYAGAAMSFADKLAALRGIGSVAPGVRKVGAKATELREYFDVPSVIFCLLGEGEKANVVSAKRFSAITGQSQRENYEEAKTHAG